MNITESLSSRLPLSKEYTVLHFQSTPRETHPLVTAHRCTTVKTQHLITLAHNDKLFYALEMLDYVSLYKDRTERLLFVSKADTSGQNDSKANIAQITQAILAHLLHTPLPTYLTGIVPKEVNTQPYDPSHITKFTSTTDALQILLKRHRGQLTTPPKITTYDITEYNPQVVTKIAFFTRSEQQYIFPNSADNANKHILDGEHLLKWWLGVVDALTKEFTQHDAHLRIPSEDPKVIDRYLTPLKSSWSIGDIFSAVDDDIAVYQIPMFNDDPKARFFEHLTVEHRVKTVTIKQFWQELEVRQEFRLGVVVSFIGISGILKQDMEKCQGVLCTLKEFKKVKNMISNEDYTDDEGSIEAYKNLSSWLESKKVDIDTLKVVGEYVKPVKIVNEVKQTGVNNLTMFVRKKQKK